MVCPVCKNVSEKEHMVCSVCGWNFAEDVTMHGILFSNLQMADYQRQIVAFRDEVQSQNRIEEFDGNDVDEDRERFFREKQERLKALRAEPAYQKALQLNHEEYAGGRNLGELFLPVIAEKNRSYGEKKTIPLEICERISNGTFEDLHVGDYFEVTMESGETVRLVLAEFGSKNETLYDIRGEEVDHYAIVVLDHCFANKESMDKRHKIFLLSELSITYSESYMYQEVLPHYAEMLQKSLNHRILHDPEGQELRLLAYENLYGDPIFAKDTIFALFEKNPESRYAKLGIHGQKRCAYWVTTGSFCKDDFNINGYFTNEDEKVSSLKKLGVRPYFYIG